MLSDSSKIVFIHTGGAWYLPYVLRQARHVSRRDTPVVLLSDVDHRIARTVLLDSLRCREAEAFGDCYEHMSSHSVEFEKFCFLRWFYLLEFMRRENLDGVFHLDSDVLLYSPLQEIRRTHGDFGDCALIVPDQEHDSYKWTCSAHISYWSSEYLEQFCDFILQSYTDPTRRAIYEEKWAWHNESGSNGGICDMTALYLFWREHGTSIENFATERQGTVLDSNVNSSDNQLANEYVMEGDCKKIAFLGKTQPAFFKLSEPTVPIRAHGIHFQGAAKKHIPEYFRGPKTLRMRAADLRRRLKARTA